MGIQTFIHLLGTLGVFPSRAFIPAFVTALLLRFGADIPVINGSGLFLVVGSAPTWFTHGLTITVLGILSVLEIIAGKNPEVRNVLNEFDGYIKPGIATLVSLGILSTQDAALATSTLNGFGDYMIALMVGGCVFFLCSLRSAILSFLQEADEDDELGLQGVLSWLEDLWTIFGVFLLIAYPMIMLVMVAIVSGGMFLIRKYLTHREEQSKLRCQHCDTSMYRSACACPQCHEKNTAPCGIGFFGQSLATPAPDLDVHPFRLAEKKRCPICATRLPERSAKQVCPGCEKTKLAEAPFSEAYQAHIAKRLPSVLGYSFLMGLVPVVGMIPAIIYYRINLVGPFRRYISFMSGCLTKWAIRLLMLILILFQIVPFFGAFMVPLMAYLEYQTYRKVYNSALKPEA